jgi:hypothetical protein
MFHPSLTLRELIVEPLVEFDGYGVLEILALTIPTAKSVRSARNRRDVLKSLDDPADFMEIRVRGNI